MEPAWTGGLHTLCLALHERLQCLQPAYTHTGSMCSVVGEVLSVTQRALRVFSQENKNHLGLVLVVLQCFV